MSGVSELNSVVDEIFSVFEKVHDMFANWTSCYHMVFIQEVMKLQALEERLYKLGFDEEFIMTVKQVVYSNVFTEDERRSYAGNWYIVS